jgi:hypothetical protein
MCSPPPDHPGNPTVDYRGEKCLNETHESKAIQERYSALEMLRAAKQRHAYDSN